MITQKMTIGETLERLNRSKFRASFHLTQKDIEYISAKGWDTIKNHCEDFVSQRIVPAQLPNDGKQTPYHGHPVFKAQHACACCCRGCLYKWYGVDPNKALTVRQQQLIVKLLMTWIKKEVNENRIS